MKNTITTINTSPYVLIATTLPQSWSKRYIVLFLVWVGVPWVGTFQSLFDRVWINLQINNNVLHGDKQSFQTNGNYIKVERPNKVETRA